MESLSSILSHDGFSAVARRQAGLQLKNRLNCSDDVNRERHQQRWLSLPEDARAVIKANLLASLGTEGYRPSAAARCIQNVAMVELPQNTWPDLVQALMSNVASATSSESCKEASYESLGYILESVVSIFLMKSYGLQLFFAHMLRLENFSLASRIMHRIVQL